MVRRIGKATGWSCAILAGALVALMAATAPGAIAAEAAPRWALTVVPSPTNLVPESPRTEVGRLTVDATSGTYRIVIGSYHHPSFSGYLPYDATAEEVAEAINSIRGSNGITVTATEEAGSATSRVYRIDWHGLAEDKSLSSLSIENIGGDTSNLTGGAQAVTYTTVTKGVSEGLITVTATNVGAAATSGTVNLSDVVPAGLTVTAVEGQSPYGGFAAMMQCEAPPAASCKWEQPVLPGGMLIMRVSVAVARGLPSSVSGTAAVSGGGAAELTRSVAMPVSEVDAPFGVAPGSLVAGLSSTQAGAHANVTTAFQLNTNEVNAVVTTPKDVRFDLPVGLVGNTVGIPRCSMHAVLTAFLLGSQCPAGSMVGMAVVTVALYGGTFTLTTPIYNIAPAPGEPAAFGFNALIAPIRLDASVLSNGNYGVRVTTPDINEAFPLLWTSITMWGVPQQLDGAGEGVQLAGSFGGPGGGAKVPLLTNPQQCSQPLSAVMSTDPWVEPGNFFSSEEVSLGMMTGCDQLRFSSSFTMVPDTFEAGAPAGYHFDLHVSQNNTADGVGTPNVKNVTVKLPAGTVISPSAAWGLKACSSAQFYGAHHPSQQPAGVAKCPRESQIGQVWLKTPALEEALEGQVYLAAPECSPCTPQDAEEGRMVKLYVQAVSEGEDGIVIKLEGKGMIDQKTGQIETVFDDNPQLPFSEFKLKLTGGPRAVLANSRSCGAASTSVDLTPWSAPMTPDSLSSYMFEINQNCFEPQFRPSFKAGVPNIQAGEFGQFTLAFGRGDDSEYLGRIETKMPKGLMGSLVGVPLCDEATANAGSCGAGSLIGEVLALTGPGADPFLVEGGKVYLTEGYGGAPFGLSIVVPAVAGPYTLSGTTGKGTVVVRAQIFVDPHSGQLTVKSGALPNMLDGIPLQIRAVDVKINRPHFMFNPTSCDKTAVTSTIGALEGMSATVSSPFQVTNCARLAFKPKFRAYTKAHHSRKEGAYLHVTLESGSGQANLREVHVELPKQLPSVLKTLQQACSEAQFAADPSGCPAGSIVGHGKAITPLLPVPIEGPAYFVSHGGAKFPELVMVLQGYGITVELNGETFISKAGITSSTFKTVPDVPVTRFDLVLPTGAHPALTGNGDLCAKSLTMPTRLVGQSGKVVEHDTRVKVQGCTPKIMVVKRRSKGAGKATIVVQVPSAGELVADGGGIVRAAKQASGAKRVPITVQLSGHARKLLSMHHDRRLKVDVHLKFKPAHGQTLTTDVSVLMS